MSAEEYTPLYPSHILNTSDYHLAQQRTPHRSEESSDHPVVPNEPQEKETDVKRRPSWISTYYRNWWFWELAGALLSAACMMAVVVLAYKINNSSLAAWKLPISPSTMISTFITIAKTSMLLPIAEGLSQLKWLYYWTTRSKYRPLDEIEAFDDASRGPWGSLLIFFRIGFRKGSFLALLGALITVATLAMGPFAQQIVSLESRSVAQPNVNSTIPIARIYDTGAIPSDDYVYNPINADSDMQGAFFNGLFNLGTPFDFTCPTGNCTWPEFSSLALCSNCGDVTGQTAREEIGGENKSAPTTLLKTPGGVSIQLNDRGSSKGYYDLLAGNTSGLYTWSTPLLATVAVAQAQGEAIGFSFEPQYDEYVRDSLSYTVTECNITWCAKRYRDVSVVNGTLENFSVEDVPLIQRGRMSLVNLTLSESTEDNVKATPLAPWKNTTFFVMYQENASTRQFLLKALTFNTISYSEEQDYVFNTGRALYKQNVTEVISNITTSMTNRIRRGRNSTVANGVVLQPDTIVVVQWSWSIVPISLVVLGFAFLAAVVCVNSSQGAPLWKSGLVPFLFHGFEDGWREQQGAQITKIERRDEMTDEAARMCVRLRPNQDDHTHFAIL